MAELILVPPVYQKTVYTPPSSSYKMETYPVMLNTMSGSPMPDARAYVQIPQPNFIDMLVNPVDDMLVFYTMGNDGSNIQYHVLSHNDVLRRFWGKEEIHEMVRRWFYDDLLIQIHNNDSPYSTSKMWSFYFTDKRDFKTFIDSSSSKIKNHRFFAKTPFMDDLKKWLKSNTRVFDIITSYNSSEIFIKDHVDAVNFKMNFVNGTDIWD